MIGSKIIDSSVWLSYLFEGKHSEYIENNETNFLSVLSLFEIKRKLLERLGKEETTRRINQIKIKSLLIDVTNTIAENAAEISHKNKVPMADSIIYATALENKLSLITLDNDFRNLPGAIVL